MFWLKAQNIILFRMKIVICFEWHIAHQQTNRAVSITILSFLFLSMRYSLSHWIANEQFELWINSSALVG